METKVKTPHEVFFMPQRLLVPLFQRPYVWTRENQWTMLWDDIRRHAELRLSGKRPSPHFLGAVVLQNQALSVGNLPYWTIIDGQQRLTTMQLLLDAAHQCLVSVGSDNLARQVEARGFAGLWVTDSFGRGRATLDPVVLMSVIAALTQKH